jgi:hypothetical protein
MIIVFTLPSSCSVNAFPIQALRVPGIGRKYLLFENNNVPAEGDDEWAEWR